MLALTSQTTGINAINIYSTQIYKIIQEQSLDGRGITPPVGAVINTTGQVIACIFSPLFSYFNFRTIINGGYLFLTITMTVVAILAYFEKYN